MSKWIKKDDQVVVIAGNEKGKVGKVLSRSQDRVIVQGVNLRKKHLKRTQQTQAAQIIDIETPIHISNVRFCKEDGSPLRIKISLKENGGKDLVYIEEGKEVVLRSIKPAR